MADEKVESSQDVGNNDTDYIEAIKNLKENSVSKEEYLKLKEKNKQLLNSLVNGEVPQGEVAEKPIDIEKLRENAFKDNQTNLEYIQNALALRQAVMDSGGVDPFVPNGMKILPTDEDFETAQRVADVFQECVDIADGDSAIFTNELQRRTIDAFPRGSKRK